jgi:hypothetical protein
LDAENEKVAGAEACKIDLEQKTKTAEAALKGAHAETAQCDNMLGSLGPLQRRPTSPSSRKNSTQVMLA